MSFEPPQDTISVDHCPKDRSDKRALKFWSLNIEDIQQNGAVGFEVCGHITIPPARVPLLTTCL